MKKKSCFPTLLLMWLLMASATIKAQYLDLANTIGTTIGPVISGSGYYKGFVEAGYAHVLGHYKGDFVEVSTTQGYRYRSWFFVGAGLGVDVLFARKNEKWGMEMVPPPDSEKARNSISTAVMLPLFTDFRFNIGSESASRKASFYADLKIGCSFLLSNKYIPIGDGYLTNQEYFFLKPAVGVRIPVNSNNSKQAFNIGITYKLLTSNYWYKYNNNITLQALGANIGFEW